MSREPRLDDTQAELLRLASISFVRARWIKAESRRLYEHRYAYGEGHPVRDLIDSILVTLEAVRAGYDEALLEATESLLWTGVDLVDGTLAAHLNDLGWTL